MIPSGHLWRDSRCHSSPRCLMSLVVMSICEDQKEGLIAVLRRRLGTRMSTVKGTNGEPPSC
jgi:hypothetical protein